MRNLLFAAIALVLATPALAHQECTQICNDTQDGRQQCHFECHQEGQSGW